MPARSTQCDVVELAPTPRTSSSGSATAGWRLTCRRMSRSISRRASRIPTALFADVARRRSAPIAYNTNLVKPEDAPKGFTDLLDPKWTGKIVKAHPGYSGTIMTATLQLGRDSAGRISRSSPSRSVMQVQSAADPPKKLALGERAVMADGAEYSDPAAQGAGEPIEAVYAAEGTPLIAGPNGIFKDAPNPNAARLFQAWSFTAEASSSIIDVGGLRSVHPQVKEQPGPQAALRHQADEGGRRRASRSRPRRSRRATRRSSRCDGRRTRRDEPARLASKLLAAASRSVARLRLRSCSRARVAAAPPAEPVTPALIEAAKKEGKVAYYTAMDLPVAENDGARPSRRSIPASRCAVERTGAERLFQRIAQEMASNIHARRRGEQLRRRALHHLEARTAGSRPTCRRTSREHFPAEMRDPDGAVRNHAHLALVHRPTTPTW